MKRVEPAEPAIDPANLHPLDAALLRVPMPATAGVLVVVLSEIPVEEATAIGEGLRQLLSKQLRAVEVAVEHDRYVSRAERLTKAVVSHDYPLLLVTTAAEPWTKAHLKPLLDAINRTDHAIGRRRIDMPKSLMRWIATRPVKNLLAAQALDAYSPCRLHRREALSRIPLQSVSDFLDVEILAKAAFFTQLVEEVDVPALAACPPLPGRLGDFFDLFRHPKLRLDSGPSEDPQRDQESPDGPRSKDQQIRPDLDDRRPLQNDGAKGVDELSERQGEQEGMYDRREPFVREENP